MRNFEIFLMGLWFQEWINDNVITDFQDYYVGDVDPNEKEGYVQCIRGEAVSSEA